MLRFAAIVPLLLLPIACGDETATDAPPAREENVIAGQPSSESEPQQPKADEPGTAPAAGREEAPEPALVVHSLANLGDSISQGFDADDSKPIDINAVQSNPESIFHDNPALSWVQGNDRRVGSIAEHYRAKDPNMVLTPISRSGAELVGKNSGLPNLEKQARSIATKNVKPDLVMVLLGGNDVCNRARSTTDDATATMYSVEEWRTAAQKGLAALEEVLPANATVRFVSMPRVDILYDQLGSTSVPVTYNTPLGRVNGSSTCRDLWTVTTANGGNGICRIVTTESSAAKRKQIGARIDAYNIALAEEVRAFNTDAAKNPKKIAFQSDWHGALGTPGGTENQSGGTFKYEPKHVSKLDCFHPSITGQQELAKLVLTKARWRP